MAEREFDRVNAGERHDPGPSTYESVVCGVCGREFEPDESIEGHVDWARLRVCPGGQA